MSSSVSGSVCVSQMRCVCFALRHNEPSLGESTLRSENTRFLLCKLLKELLDESLGHRDEPDDKGMNSL